MTYLDFSHVCINQIVVYTQDIQLQRDEVWFVLTQVLLLSISRLLWLSKMLRIHLVMCVCVCVCCVFTGNSVISMVWVISNYIYMYIIHEGHIYMLHSCANYCRHEGSEWHNFEFPYAWFLQWSLQWFLVVYSGMCLIRTPWNEVITI